MPADRHPLLEKGKPGTLLDVDRANPLIADVNKLRSMQVMPDSSLPLSQSRFEMGNEGAVFILGTKPG